MSSLTGVLWMIVFCRNNSTKIEIIVIELKCIKWQGAHDKLHEDKIETLLQFNISVSLIYVSTRKVF